MQIAHKKIKERLVKLMTEAQTCNGVPEETSEAFRAGCRQCCSDELKAMFNEWIANKNNAEITKKLYEPIVAACEACTTPHSSELSGEPVGCEKCQEILKYKDHLVKRSQWIIGGDDKVF